MERKDKIVTVIAGPNGAGKTSLQSLLRQAHLVAQGGHNVGRNSIESNYYEGLNNLNDSFQDWDKLYIIDNSKDISKNDIENLPLILYIENGNIEYISPSIDNNILESNFPKIAKKLLKQDT